MFGKDLSVHVDVYWHCGFSVDMYAKPKRCIHYNLWVKAEYSGNTCDQSPKHNQMHVYPVIPVIEAICSIA